MSDKLLIRKDLKSEFGLNVNTIFRERNSRERLKMSQFSAFLIEFFTEKQIDASVYESYVISILEEETDESETIEALSDILASLIDVRMSSEII